MDRAPYRKPISSLEGLNRGFASLFALQNRDLPFLFAHIKRYLKQFNLDNYGEEGAVLNEAYMRAYGAIESGQVIENLYCWLKGTSFNIVREMSRDKRRFVDCEQGEIAVALQEEDYYALDGATVKAARAALAQLKSKERLLLELRILKNLSWKQVGEALVAEGEKAASEVALRQRGHRALEHIRKRLPPQDN